MYFYKYSRAVMTASVLQTHIHDINNESYSIKMLNAFLQWSKPRAEGPDPSQKHSGELRNDERCLYSNVFADSLCKRS